jgi:hypothetical protein
MAMTSPQRREKEVEVYAGYNAEPLLSQNLLEEIVPKNPELTLRWGNCVAGGGLRLSQLVYSGFEIFKPDELMMKKGGEIPAMMIKDGRVMYGDLVATKISKAKYFGALKHNHNSAVASANRTRMTQDDAKQVTQEILKGKSNEIASKIRAYVPSEQELKALTETEGK